MDSSAKNPEPAFALSPPLLARVDALVTAPGAPRAVTSDDRYHDLRQELDKLSSLAGGEVDWRRISTLGEALTREVGKDLGVIAYLALAYHHLHDHDGLLVGVHTLARLLRAPPALLTPAKPRGRASAVEWLLARVLIVAQTSDALPLTHAAGLELAARELRGAAREALADLAPSFGPLMQALQRLRELAGPDTSPGAAAPAAAPEVPAATPSIQVSDASPDLASAPPEAASSELPEHRFIAAATAWLAPIDPSSPCGVDPAGREGFIDAQDELAKLASPSGGAVDWARVEAGSDAVLLRISKDLRAAAWFTLARAHRVGPSGLALGLTIVVGLFESFGEAIFPRKLRSVRDQSEWLIKHTAAALRDTTADIDAPLLATLRALGERLAVVLRARLGEDAPSLRPLRDILAERSEQLAARTPVVPPERPPAPEPSAPVPSPSAAVPAPAPAAAPLAPLPTVVADSADLDKFLGATGEALEQAARSLREAAPADPRAYRLLRTGLWLHLVAAPPLRPDGNTALPGLEARDHAQLAELAAAARWAGLLARSENLLATRRLALDLQRHTAAALVGLGPEYAAAADAVRIELRSLLARLPGLAALRDRDGQPLADPDTQRWLTSEVLPRPAARAPTTAADTPEFWTELRPRLRGETRSEALSDAQRHIDAGRGEHQRFLRRLGLAELCDEQDPSLATHLFAALADDLERRALDPWDPSLAARTLTGLARAQHRARDLPAWRRALQRLGNLDASAAAALLAELPEPRA